jgi:GNAT superfamily N-acetyltransferase
MPGCGTGVFFTNFRRSTPKLLGRPEIMVNDLLTISSNDAGRSLLPPESRIVAVPDDCAIATCGAPPDAQPPALRVRAAAPADLPALLAMKWQLAILEKTELAMRATEQDWLRDGFGPDARFQAYVAERGDTVIGMVTVSERYYTGWAGSSLYIQDVFVAPAHRKGGVAVALLARVAARAVERGCPFVELAVRDDNPARKLYRRTGFVPVKHSIAHVLGGTALADLAGQEAAGKA